MRNKTTQALLRRLAPIFGIFLLVSALPQPAAAQSRAVRVYFVTLEAIGDDVPSVVVSQINRDLIDRLDGTRNLELIHRAETATESTETTEVAQHNAAIDEAEQLYQSGIGLYVVEDFEAAVAAFDEMMRLFEENIGEVRNWNMLADGLLRLGECQFKAGNERLARETLHRVLTIRPELNVDPAQTGQAFAALAEEIREDVAERNAGDLDVSVSNVEGTIFVDGMEVGTAPVTVGDLAPGEHFVVAVAPTGEVAGRAVVVERRRGAEVELTISSIAILEDEAEDESGEPVYVRSLRREVRNDHVSDTLLPYLQELTTRQGVDYVILGAVVADPVGYVAHAFIYRAEDGRFAPIDAQAFDAELANVTVNVYAFSQEISGAVRSFPSGYVSGQTLRPEEVEVAEVPAETAGSEFAVPVETGLDIPSPVVVAPPVTEEPVVAETPTEEPPVVAEVVEPEVEEEPVVTDPVPPEYADPVPPELGTDQPPVEGYPYGYPYVYPPPGYGYPPATDENAEGTTPTYGYPYGYPPPGYGYPPPGYGYPPPGYGYPPATEENAEGTTPAYGYPYGYPPPGYGYPPPEGYEGYGYPPPEGYEGYGYPPPEGYEGYGSTDGPTEDANDDVAYADDDLYGDLMDDDFDDDADDDDDDDDDEDSAIYEEWWFWATSAGVVGVAITTIAIVAGGDEEPVGDSGFRTTVVW